MEYLIRRGRYASCVHARGLSCFKIILFHAVILKMEITEAVEAGDVAKVTELLKHYSEHDQDDLNKALVKTGEKKEWECVKLLVNAGADPTAKGYRYKALNLHRLLTMPSALSC